MLGDRGGADDVHEAGGDDVEFDLRAAAGLRRMLAKLRQRFEHAGVGIERTADLLQQGLGEGDALLLGHAGDQPALGQDLVPAVLDQRHQLVLAPALIVLDAEPLQQRFERAFGQGPVEVEA
jgi:hypothetical protein